MTESRGQNEMAELSRNVEREKRKERVKNMENGIRVNLENPFLFIFFLLRGWVSTLHWV